MSVCISQHGEFGSHGLDATYRCVRCGVLDEDQLIAEVLLLQRELDEAHRFELGVADALGFDDWEHPSDLFLQVRALQLMVDEFDEPYGECSPDCDCAGHEGPNTCDCHITGAEARARIEGLIVQVDAAEAERDRLLDVYRKAEMLRDRYPQELTPRNSAQELRDLVAAVDAYRATPDAAVVSAPLISAHEAPNPQPLRKKSHYSIPGLDGTWRFMGLETTNMGADGRAILHMVREPAATPDAEPAPDVPAIQVEPHHSGRSWSGNELEAECPCPKEACGLVDLSRAVPECTQHPITRGKTMRQGHPADKCPALPMPGVPVDTEEESR